MKTYTEFHDGALEGVLLEDKSALLFLCTTEKVRSVFKVDGLLRLKMVDFRQGSIVFDVRVREGNEINLDDVMEAFGFKDEAKAMETLKQVRQEQHLVLEVNPSYGAILILIAKSLRVMSRQAWFGELVITGNLLGVEST